MRLYILLTLSLLLLSLPSPNQTIPKHLSIAEGYVGTTEKTGHNDGPEIEKIIKHGGGAKGASYCGYFIWTILDSAQVKTPKVRSGMARGYKIKSSIDANDVLIGKVKIPPGTLVIFQKGETIFGHVGIVKSWGKKYGYTVEANTSPNNTGSQSNGDGIWYKYRSIQPLNYFRVRWFTLVTY